MFNTSQLLLKGDSKCSFSPWLLVDKINFEDRFSQSTESTEMIYCIYSLEMGSRKMERLRHF